MSYEMIKTEADAVGAASSVFVRLLGPAADQVGGTFGDWARYWRCLNMIKIGKKLAERIEAEGLDDSKLHHLPLSVGLPLIERASCHDDSVLQEKWANLMASWISMDDPSEDFSSYIMHIEMLNQMTRLDCEVLEFVCEQGIKYRDVEQDSMVANELEPALIEAGFPGRMAHASVDKLCALGAMQRVISAPLKRSSENVSGFRETIVPTLVGLNLYLTSSGKTPGWMKDK